MLGFECRRAVVQEPRARHSAMQQQQQKLICWRRRSSWQFEAGVDDPRTEGKVSRRPSSTCRASRLNLEAEHAHLLVQDCQEALVPGCASTPQPTRR